jgi:hypothetical protein
MGGDDVVRPVGHGRAAGVVQVEADNAEVRHQRAGHGDHCARHRAVFHHCRRQDVGGIFHRVWDTRNREFMSGLRIRIRINLSCWIRIRIQERKNDPQKKKKVNKFHVLNCWMFSSEG